MSPHESDPNPAHEPDLHLLLSATFLPLWRSLFHGLSEFFFPRKLPPLKLESKPIPVKDIWGTSSRRNGALSSAAAHVLMLGLILRASWTPISGPTPAPSKPLNVTAVIDPLDYPLKPASTQAGGGGGGGDHDILQAAAGHLPKSSMRQITPPAAVIRNPNPRLPVEATIIAPPDIYMTMNDLPNLGGPKSSAAVPSNGPGANGGIGEGSDGGVGPGRGRGEGPGDEAGRGGDVFRWGKGVIAPRVVYQIDPQFSEEARKAKFQGNCVLGLVVDAQGRPTNIRILSALGMGLDEKAIESVKNWKFEPGKKDGHAVAVEIAVEVDFHLY